MKCRQRQRKQHGIHWLLLMLLFLVACGDEVEPTATPDVPLLPTLAPTSTAVATSAPAAAPAVLPTESSAVISPLTITSSAAVSPLPTLTTTVAVTAASTLSDTAVLVPTPVARPEDCTTAVDIALTSYPDLVAILGCALDAASFEPVAINEFGPGPDYDRFMLWFSSENQIYTLLPSKSWARYPDTWTEDQATFSCNPLEGEATSPPLPRRGFGKIWCSDPALQETMGLVEREERLCQHTVTQRFQQGRLIACYEDATIRFFRVMDDGTWDQVLTR